MISVIMPVYKVESYLEESIISVLEQTYKDFELILVDDGSPDGCPEICDRYAQKDSRVRVIHKENGGLSSARNAGLSIAQGEYVYMIDSDDSIEPFTLEKALQSAKENNSDLVIVGVCVKNYSSGQLSNMVDLSRKEMVLQKESIADNLPFLINNSMFNYAWDKLYRRDTIIKNNIWYNSYFDRVCEDTVFLYDLLPYLSIISTVKDICYHYNIRDDQSVVKKYIPDRFDKYIKRLEKLIEVSSFINAPLEMQKIIAAQYANSVVWSINNVFHKDSDLASQKSIYHYLLWMSQKDLIRKRYFWKALQFEIRSNDSRRDKLLFALYTLKHFRLGARFCKRYIL